MKRLLVLCLFAAGCASDPPAKTLPLEQQPVRTRSIDDAIADGVSFLLKSQEKGGYWGTGCRPLGWDIYASAPGSHAAFRVATTGLAVRALREIGTPEALASAVRGEDWLMTKGVLLRRASRDEIYNIWGHTYALQALSLAVREEKDPARLERLKAAARENIDRLVMYSTIYGGWNYYDFNIGARNPSMEPTSFGTSAGLIALKEAQDAGLEVPAHLVKMARRIVEKCRTPDNCYFYSYDHRWYPMFSINRPGGSAGRTQAGNDALFEWASTAVSIDDVRGGLDMLFKFQKFLECGRKRPYPHEAYYYVAGYFYYFGHYYASRMLQFLPAGEAKAFALKLSETIRPKQEEDGSWWDFGMWDFHKPYGTAFALMTLKRCRDAARQAP